MDQILSLLGIAAKAGKVVSGEFSTEKAVKQKRVFLVIIAGDASANTRKLFTDKCRSYDVPLRVYSEKEPLARAIGCTSRASVGVTDEGFAKALLNKLDALGREGPLP